MLQLLREFAVREGIGYQVLMKQWLDDRLSLELKRIEQARRATGSFPTSRTAAATPRAPQFPLVDTTNLDGPHLRSDMAP